MRACSGAHFWVALGLERAEKGLSRAAPAVWCVRWTCCGHLLQLLGTCQAAAAWAVAIHHPAPPLGPRPSIPQSAANGVCAAFRGPRHNRRAARAAGKHAVVCPRRPLRLCTVAPLAASKKGSEGPHVRDSRPTLAPHRKRRHSCCMWALWLLWAPVVPWQPTDPVPVSGCAVCRQAVTAGGHSGQQHGVHSAHRPAAGESPPHAMRTVGPPHHHHPAQAGMAWGAPCVVTTCRPPFILGRCARHRLPLMTPAPLVANTCSRRAGWLRLIWGTLGSSWWGAGAATPAAPPPPPPLGAAAS